ncbi:hypothetical protein NE865_16006 [Phthorimaea operculella]|nr:hypothetical protein NE865_16006 [Phthorimaea operculella]
MAQHILFGVLVVLACFYSETASRPSKNESPTSLRVELPIEDVPQIEYYDDQKSLPEEETTPEPEKDTQHILDKIKAINDKLRKPQKQKFNFNAPLYTGGPYILDKAILEKIQQVIASAKLHGAKDLQKQQTDEQEESSADEDAREGHERALQFLQPEIANNVLPTQTVAMVPLPYVINMPVLVTPTPVTGYSTNNEINAFDATPQYSTRQRPSLPFQIQWPLGGLFPVLIKDPLLHYLQGGTWQTLIDYGQNADICSRKQKSSETEENSLNKDIIVEENNDKKLYEAVDFDPFKLYSSRQGRKIKNKRTVSNTAPQQALNKKSPIKKSVQTAKASAYQNDVKRLPNIFQKQTTQKPLKKVTQTDDDDERVDGDLRFPFGDFTFFGNRKPVAPSPGFFINRLKVRRGGVAIAGPGGVATAGRGGTAVVGPGGLAYTQPGGLAVAGPSAKVVALSQDADLNSIISRLHQQASTDDSTPDGEDDETGEVSEERAGPTKMNISAPTAAQVNYRRYRYDSKTKIVQLDGTLLLANRHRRFGVPDVDHQLHQQEPRSSSLRVNYLPFYGGAKGQYLEVKEDPTGAIVSEKIVSEENISSENIVKNNGENLLARVLAANLQSLKTLSTSVLKLQTLGRKTGGLSPSDKARFRSELGALGETASNTIKLIEELGDNVDMLFTSNHTKRQYDHYEDDVGEEGVGIDSPSEHPGSGIPPIEALEGTIIAQAAPIGLAVVGENGLASSRPVGTAGDTAAASSGTVAGHGAITTGQAVYRLDVALFGIKSQLVKS